MTTTLTTTKTVTWDAGFKQLASGQFWADVLERSVRTFLSVFVPALGVTTTVKATDVLHLPWLSALVAGAVPTALTVLLSVASALRKGSDPQSGSFLRRPVKVITKLVAPSEPYTQDDVEQLRGGFVRQGNTDLGSLWVDVVPDIGGGRHEADDEPSDPPAVVVPVDPLDPFDQGRGPIKPTGDA